MKVIKNTIDPFTEISEARTDIEKQQLLMKHGVIPAKLTFEEQDLITKEETGRGCYETWQVADLIYVAPKEPTLYARF
jgi:hypothetical protein